MTSQVWYIPRVDGSDKPKRVWRWYKCRPLFILFILILMLSCLKVATYTPADSTSYINPIPKTMVAKDDTQIELLSRMIHCEARGEGFQGKVAVGAVIMNRVKSDLFPNTIEEVINQPGQFPPLWQGMVDKESEEAARQAYKGHDPTGGALYFYNPTTASCPWIRTLPINTTIGEHTFCKGG